MSTYEHSNETYVKSGLKLQVLLNQVPILRNSAKLSYKEKYLANFGQESGQNWSN